jgi:adenylate cyclase
MQYLRIRTTHGGREQTREFNQGRILIGRPGGTTTPDLDLSPDPCVSRQHAVLELSDGCWIEDAGSRYGTKINGREIRGKGRFRVAATDELVLGGTRLRIEMGSREEGAPTAAPNEAERGLRVLHSLDAGPEVAMASSALETVKERQLATLCDLPLQFAQQTSLEALLPLIVRGVVDIIPAAKRGAILLRPQEDGPLLLKAFVSESKPAVSDTLARRALNERRAVVWRRDVDMDPTRSIERLQIETGMYAPLIWGNKSVGVLCVDSPEAGASFTSEDLRLMMSVCQYAAVAVANFLLQEELRQNSRILGRLLSNFSPKLRQMLLDRAKSGRLRLGGENSEVTLLLCDLCGFTTTSAGLESGEIVEMLNDYLQTLAQILFRHDGTIDKYIGDAVLAVFGSPEPDAFHCEKAVRAAVEMQLRIEEVNQRRKARGEPVCSAAIGVHCGIVFHGFIGTAERLEFTVIGDAVNRTSRYCAGAGPGQVVVSQEVFERVFNLVTAESVAINSKEGELKAYHVSGLLE